MYLIEMIEVVVSPQITFDITWLFDVLPIHAAIKELRANMIDDMYVDACTALLITVKAAPLLVESICIIFFTQARLQ